jgi:hypothetical protein
MPAALKKLMSSAYLASEVKTFDLVESSIALPISIEHDLTNGEYDEYSR